MHCPQSPQHQYACCRSQECGCWCHEIVNPLHKTIVSKATPNQRNAAERAYIEHQRVCADVGINPEDFGRFIAEWLECSAIEQRKSVEAAGVISDGNYPSRNYDRMFEGKRGWD